MKKQGRDRGLAARQATKCACQDNTGAAARGSGRETGEIQVSRPRFLTGHAWVPGQLLMISEFNVH